MNMNRRQLVKTILFPFARFFKYQNVRQCSSSKRKRHVYTFVSNWGSTAEFQNFIINNVLHNENGLLALNKPYGVGKWRRNVNEKYGEMVDLRLRSTLACKNDFCLEDFLPYISKHFGYNQLQIINIPERYSSGITLLSANEEVTTRVKKAIAKSKAVSSPFYYWVVTVGCPEPMSECVKLGLKKEVNPITKENIVVLTREWTQNSVKRKDVTLVNVEHSVICKQSLACLVEVRPSANKSYFIRKYMCDALSPVLGDNICGSLVRTVLGVPLKISPFSDIAKLNQRLDDNLLSVLALQRKEECLIPTHLHHCKLVLKDFKGKGQPLILQAPPPEYFRWTCKQLQLKLPEVPVLEPVTTGNEFSTSSFSCIEIKQ